MSVYTRGVPPELFDSDSEGSDEFYDCCSKTPVKTKCVPYNMGFKAGLDGCDFDIKLGSTAQLRFNELKDYFAANFKNQKLLELIKAALALDPNPYVLALKFFANDISIVNTESFSFAVLESLEMVKKERNLEGLLDDNTKVVAFNFFKEQNLSTIKLGAKIFELVSSNKLFVDEIRNFIDRRSFTGAAQLAIQLQLFGHFDLDELLIPLFLEDKMALFEEYLDKSPRLQLKTIKFFDSLLKLPLDSIFERCEPMIQRHSIRNFNPVKLMSKAVSTLITRLAKKYKISIKCFPHRIFYHRIKKLGFYFRSFYDQKKTSRAAFEECVRDSMKDRNPDMQAELMRRCVLHEQLDDAVYFMKKYKIPESKTPPEVIEYSKAIKQTSLKMVSFAEPDWTTDPDEDHYELPLKDSQIFFIDTVGKFWDMLHRMMLVIEVGFDVEHTLGGEIAIIQIATKESIFIIDVPGLMELGLSEIFWRILGKNLFNNASISKIGFDFGRDMEMIREIEELEVQDSSMESYLDLKKLVTGVCRIDSFQFPFPEEFSALSLSKLTKMCLGKSLNKLNQLSDWCHRPLRREQLIYAATDAFVLIEIKDVIEDKLSKAGITRDEIVNNVNKF